MKTALGKIATEGAGGDVFKDGGSFFYTLNSMDFDEDDNEVWIEAKSHAFDTLNDLIADLPQGVHYLPGK